MLKDLFHLLDWTEIILTIGAAIGSVLLTIYRKRLAQWRKFWHSVFEGLRTIPELKSDIKGIRYYVTPNGGGSLMDCIKRTETVIGTLSEQVSLVVHTMWADNDSDNETARFHSSAEGEYTYVNQLFARWLGVGKAELLGWNFLNFIHVDDVEKVRQHWAQCHAEHRQYRLQYRLVAASGTAFEVAVIATPIPENSDQIKRWIGVVRRVDNG